METEITLEQAIKICEDKFILIEKKPNEVIPLDSRTIKKEGVAGIMKRVCERRGISIVDIQKETRKRELVEVRQLCQYIAKKHTPYSLADIAWFIGDQNHATVLHAIKTITNLLDTNSDFRYKYYDIIIKYRLLINK